MLNVNVQEVTSRLPELLDRVASGEVIVIARGGRPVARLTPIENAPRRTLGQDRGLYEIPEDFDAPLPEEILRSFEG